MNNTLKSFFCSLLTASCLGLAACDEDNPVSPQPPQVRSFEADVVFSKRTTGYMSNMEQELVRLINNAQSSIRMDMPRLDSHAIIEALVAAKQREVYVEVCLDAGNPSETLSRLREAEIYTRTRSSSSQPSYQHRFVILDNQRVWVGSHIATEAGNTQQDSSAALISSNDLAGQFTTAFNRKYGTGFPFAELHRSDGAELAVRFTPYDDVEAFMVEEIAKATSEIRFMSVMLKSKAVAQALAQKAAQGLKIEGVFESKGADEPESQFSYLLEQGVDVKRDGNPSEMAHQVFVIDGQTVLSGSREFQGGKGNLQHVLALRKQPAFAQAFLNEYQRVRTLSR